MSCRTSWLSLSFSIVRIFFFFLHCSYFHSFSVYSLSAEDVLPNDLQLENIPSRSALP